MRINIYDEFNIKNIDKKIELESYNMVFFQLHPPTKSPKKSKKLYSYAHKFIQNLGKNQIWTCNMCITKLWTMMNLLKLKNIN